MKRNMLSARIASCLLLGTGMLFACPTPMPKLEPLLVAVHGMSVAALDFYIPKTDDDTYDIVTGDSTITVVTISPADANSPANGGAWDGVVTIT